MEFLLISAVLYALNNYLWKVRLLDVSALEVTWGRSVFSGLFSMGLVAWSGFDALHAAWSADGGLYLAAVTAGGAGLLGLVRGGLLAFSFHIWTHRAGKFSLQANSWLALMVLGFTLAAFLSWTLVRRHLVGVYVATQEWFVLGKSTAYAPWLKQAPHFIDSDRIGDTYYRHVFAALETSDLFTGPDAGELINALDLVNAYHAAGGRNAYAHGDTHWSLTGAGLAFRDWLRKVVFNLQTETEAPML